MHEDAASCTDPPPDISTSPLPPLKSGGPIEAEPEPGAFAQPGSMMDYVSPPVGPMSPQALVRGGTTSWAYDKEMAMRLSEADQRRAQDQAERHLGQIPIEQGGALNFERKLADPLQGPRVLLEYVGRGQGRTARTALRDGVR